MKILWVRYQLLSHLLLILGIAFLALPLWMVFASSTHEPTVIIRDGMQLSLSDQFFETYLGVLTEKKGFTEQVTASMMMINSMILGVGFAVGKIIVSMTAAYAIVYFRFPLATLLFWVIFTTLLLPLEVRIIPSYKVVADLGMLNSYAGLIIPLIASATGTFYFRQFFRSVPDELLEAAKLDGAGAWKFFIDILMPLSRTMMAALFIIMFVVGWNQYLWPLLMTTDESYSTIVLGIKSVMQTIDGNRLPEYNRGFALAILALIPPVLIVVFFQRWFIKGLLESDK
jgi:sn-glycerol 3-phosphate transport system permease protein